MSRVSADPKGIVKPLVDHFEGLKDRQYNSLNQDRGGRRALGDVSNKQNHRDKGQRPRKSRVPNKLTHKIHGDSQRLLAISAGKSVDTRKGRKLQSRFIPTPSSTSETNETPTPAATPILILRITYTMDIVKRYLIELDPMGATIEHLARQRLNDTVGTSKIFLYAYPWLDRNVRLVELEPESHLGQKESAMAYIPEPAPAGRRNGSRD